MHSAETTRLPAWPAWRQAVRATLLLGQREIRTVLRTPAIFIPNLVVPLFFYFVMVGSLEDFATRSGVQNWQAFQIPVAIMFAVQGGSAGLNMVADIESGYFDKLMLTPASRLAVLIGAMSADFLRIMVQAALVVGLAVLAGGSIATGLPGAAAMVLLGGFWGLSYSGLGFAIALKTGNSQATQSMWVLFMPLMFLTTVFAPMDALSGWLKVAATINPMTYFLRGMREIAISGWDLSEIGVGVLAVAVLGCVSISLALMALRGRVA